MPNLVKQYRSMVAEEHVWSLHGNEQASSLTRTVSCTYSRSLNESVLRSCTGNGHMGTRGCTLALTFVCFISPLFSFSSRSCWLWRKLISLKQECGDVKRPGL